MDAVDIKVIKRLMLTLTAAIIHQSHEGVISYSMAADHAIELLDQISLKLDERKGG